MYLGGNRGGFRHFKLHTGDAAVNHGLSRSWYWVWKYYPGALHRRNFRICKTDSGGIYECEGKGIRRGGTCNKLFQYENYL